MATTNAIVSLNSLGAKAGIYSELGVATGAVLNVFEIYFELRFATSQDVKAGSDLEHCVAPRMATTNSIVSLN